MPAAILSASRRTDIPAFYMPWFMKSLKQGRFEVINPYNGTKTFVPADLENVHSIVFWSKNFGPFFKGRYHRALKMTGYNLFFNFTINSGNYTLEPCVPPLKERLIQLDRLSAFFGPQAIQWRFDPICLYKEKNGNLNDNLNEFEFIAASAARMGISRCITSFVDLYSKVQKRTAKHGMRFIDPSTEKKIQILLGMQKTLSLHKIQLGLCCEKELLAALPENSGIESGACICAERLMELYGGKLSTRKDTGQRRTAGCGCSFSKDIGSYARHPCPHNCLFCYANPAPASPKLRSRCR
ncbi:MAG: DUF1848 domain-containing protein [Desulfobacteraceae bacterium]|nr:DUF1848 domain-containing protein [Desulfobacteraceae bacterium]